MSRSASLQRNFDPHYGRRGAGRARRPAADRAQPRSVHLRGHQHLHRRHRQGRGHRSGPGRRIPTFARSWRRRPARRSPTSSSPIPTATIPAGAARLGSGDRVHHLRRRAARSRGGCPAGLTPASTQPSSRTSPRRRRRWSTATAGGSRRSPRPATPGITSPSRSPTAACSSPATTSWAGRQRRGAAGRRDGRLHGLARPAASPRRGHVPARPRRASPRRTASPRAESPSPGARGGDPRPLWRRRCTIPAIVATIYPDLDPALIRRRPASRCSPISRT